ncbi:pyridoxamine 5'-phosphate oxidase family protein [Candidatus Kaiserbacteria bacterium]|nr:pyridoxamine 5'-phosphate oxidase family protein [Candidatus Kaiserbacteria bacterium]USN92581.1 MAG: pyridoxamine 5'-phosphate oxidase family protein [Candidatus Nomurabacteria bacterium]
MDKLELLKEYVVNGKVLQLATITEGGPWVCHVWYVADWDNDRLLFTSRTTRNHSVHIEYDHRVAGGILDMELTSLGQSVRGVSFTGSARVVPLSDLLGSIYKFSKRWPAADLAHAAIANGSTNIRLYEININKWVLHDEVNMPSDPRFEYEPNACDGISDV